MKSILVSLVTIGAVLIGTSANLSQIPGVTASIDLNLFTEAKDIYTNMIVKSVNNLTLENYDFSNGKGYLHDNDLQVLEKPEDITLKRISNTTF